ncbi:STRUBBELIG-RECEPTOR FAMILY 3-like protein [Drosera capensis]
MGRKRSGRGSLVVEIYHHFLVAIALLCLGCLCHGYTDPSDVAAISGLYTALGSPALPGWVPIGGDPCLDNWQGVACVNSNIISITLVGANLGGELGDSLGSFTSIQTIDFSNNNIGGSVPSSLPSTLQSFFLSDNNLTGSIPSSISSPPQLSGLKLNNNHLTGEIPDALQSLSSLANMDLANNSLSGQLPVSMADLSALASLHLQYNDLSGILDVLQDLPLVDLDVRYNQFSGPIPAKMLSIKNFQKEGNPFNTSVSPLPSPTSPTPPQASEAPPPLPPPGTPSSGTVPGKHAATGPSAQEPESGTGKKKYNARKIVLIAILSVIGFIILILALLLCTPICLRRSRELYRYSKREEVEPYIGSPENLPINVAGMQLGNEGNQADKAPKNSMLGPKHKVLPEIKTVAAISESRNQRDPYAQRKGPLLKQDSDISMSDISSMMPPPPPPPLPLHFPEKVIVMPKSLSDDATEHPVTRTPIPSTSVRSFSVASLQEYTNSFSQDNLIASGMFGSVYRAELPDGKLLAVKKLDKSVTSRLKEHDFIDLVSSVDRLRHANILDLVGHCSEHSQRLLIYEYCSNGSLQDALHSEDGYKKKLSWNTRMQITLGAARALEYLHEVCEPPVMHRNFKATNILLDDELNVRVSDCGLAPLIASGLVSQLSGQLQSTYGYGAPEYESGIYTHVSDVFSFGVVMLELLTGRMAYDNARVRGEQILVRWAIPQLHDIEALTGMVDPSLDGEYPTKSLSNYADIISRCVQSEPEFRPLMSEVVQDLQIMLQRGSPPKKPAGNNTSLMTRTDDAR